MGVDADAVTPDTVGPLPPPLYVVLRHDDGREETFHGARFSGANRFVLRDIQGASASIERSFLAPLSSAADWGYTGVLDGLPTRITAPAVWIGEMELVPSPGDVRDLPVLPLPSPGNEDGA